MEFPLGSVWLQSSVKTLSEVLYRCADRNVFPEQFSVGPHTAVPMVLLVSKSPSRMDCLAHAGGLCFTGGKHAVSILWLTCAHHVKPDIVNRFTLCRGLSGRISLLLSAHGGERAFPGLCLFFPSIYQRRGVPGGGMGNLDFNADLSASFLLPWVIHIFFYFVC